MSKQINKRMDFMADNMDVIIAAMKGKTALKDGQYGEAGNVAYDKFRFDTASIMGRCVNGLTDEHKKSYLKISYDREVADYEKKRIYTPAELSNIKAALAEAYDDLKDNLVNCTLTTSKAAPIQIDFKNGDFYVKPSSAASKPAASR